MDADSRFLWRFPPRRLEAEVIRDTILAVTGALENRVGGPGFYLLDVDRENVVHYFPKEETGPAEWRRMVYMFKIRQEQDAVFGSFDCPDGNQVTPKRSSSTTPLQALNLFNSRFVIQQAGLLAKRLAAEAGGAPSPGQPCLLPPLQPRAGRRGGGGSARLHRSRRPGCLVPRHAQHQRASLHLLAAGSPCSTNAIFSTAARSSATP